MAGTVLQFRLRSILLLTSIVAINLAMLQIGWIATWLSTTFTLALIATYHARINLEKPQMHAAIIGNGFGSLWGGGTFAVGVYLGQLEVAELVGGFLIGVSAAFLVGVVAACVVALFPEAPTRYLGQRDGKKCQFFYARWH